MKRMMSIGWRLFLLVFILFIALSSSSSAPAGAEIMVNGTYNYTPPAAAQIITAGGSFATLTINITAQTPRWKAYVGNVSGLLTLDDSTNKSIYDWTPSVITGEIYASRSNDIEWDAISCPLNATIATEMATLQMDENATDNINHTFNISSHRGFYVGTVPVNASTCPAIATFVNNTRQAISENAIFQEVLLEDAAQASIIFTTLLENNRYGFNNQIFDFQIILPNNEFAATPTPYYFYAEIG
jgi:hypothetical protein